MDRALVRLLLRRIALGLPLVEIPRVRVGRRMVGGALLIGAGLTGCTRCDVVQTATSTHPASTYIASRVGPPEAFDPSECEALCRELDSPSRDAGMGPDAGGFVGLDSFTSTPRCAYEGTEILRCTYEETRCTTQSLCSTAVAGRAPAGLLRGRPSVGGGALGDWLSENARLEAASVLAFEELAGELDRFGAPTVLSLAARRSADDERRHARAVRTLADRVSAPRLSIERAPFEERSLAEVALDNAVEGEIRETFGTFVAAMQAERAESLAVRRAYASIAVDEARHALLSFALDDWMLPQLSSRERRGIEAAKRERAAQFGELVAEPSAELAHALGLPDATRSMDLLALVAG